MFEDVPLMWSDKQGSMKLRLNEDGEYEVEDDEEKYGRSRFSIKMHQDPICSLNNFTGKSIKVQSSSQNLLSDEKSSVKFDEVLGHKIAISRVGDSVTFTDGDVIACCKLQE